MPQAPSREFPWNRAATGRGFPRGAPGSESPGPSPGDPQAQAREDSRRRTASSGRSTADLLSETEQLLSRSASPYLQRAVSGFRDRLASRTWTGWDFLGAVLGFFFVIFLISLGLNTQRPPMLDRAPSVSAPTPAGYRERAPKPRPTATPSAAQGARPVITAVYFPTTISADGRSVPGTVAFWDPEGDVSYVYFSVVQGDFRPFSFDPQVRGKVHGSFGFRIYCRTPQWVRLRVELQDRAGHRSQPTHFTFRCVDTGSK